MEIFHKAFEASIALSPQDVLKRIEGLKGTYTKVQYRQDEDGFLVEIEHSSIVTISSLRFRISKPDENMRLSQISGVASAKLDWFGFSIPGFLLLLLPCCACVTLFFVPQRRFEGSGFVEPALLARNSPWMPFIIVAGLLATVVLLIILEILFATFARNKYIKAVLALFDAELIREKEKREKLKY
jgi:hypothetical protein